MAAELNSIVISLGGLRVHHLGCYGGAWGETPAFDRFASEGFVFDECFVESPNPAAARHAWETGCYQNFRRPDEPARPNTAQPCLLRVLRSAGVRTVLVRDSGELVENPRSDSGAFDHFAEIDRSHEDSTACVFEAATQWIRREAARGRFLLFIDCHGAHPPWYPPETSDESSAESEEIDEEQDVDEDAEDSVEVDASATHASSESDASDQAWQVYAAVVAHLDSELASFLDFIRGRAEWEQSLVVITSDCGTNLEDQHAATPERSFLHEGGIHVPLLLHMPGTHDPASRSAALIQSIDLMPTVCDTLGVAISHDIPGRSLLPIVRSQTRSVREDALMADAERGWSIRAPAWHLVLPLIAAGSELSPEPRLFVKPDDRWDRNDVAKQYPHVVEQLEQKLRSHIDVPNLQITNEKSQTSSNQ